jgi:hypothetical protein
MLVSVCDQEINYVAGIRLRTEFRQQLGEIGIAHAIDGFLRELPRFIQLIDNASFVGG